MTRQSGALVVIISVVVIALGIEPATSSSSETDLSLMEESITINRPVMRSSATEFMLRTGSSNSGTVTCSCNLPTCVSTGYLCKSTLGVCFSDLRHGHLHGLHGCISDKSHIGRCMQRSAENEASTGASSKSKFSCCYKDLCNHAEVPTRDSQTDLPQKQVSNNDSDSQKIESQTDGYYNAEVWFKAATIAVPICGAVILLVLILLAIKILKTESMNGFSTNKLGNNYCAAPTKHHDHYHQPSANHRLYRDALLPSPNATNMVNYKNNNPVGIHPYAAPLLMEIREINPLNHRTQPLVHQNTPRNPEKNMAHAHLNYFHGHEYNPLLLDIHKCYDNKGNNVVGPDVKSSCPEFTFDSNGVAKITNETNKELNMNKNNSIA